MNCYICNNVLEKKINYDFIDHDCVKCGIKYLSNDYLHIKRSFLVPHTLIINNLNIYLNIDVVVINPINGKLFGYIKCELPNYIRCEKYFDTNPNLSKYDVKNHIKNIYKYINNLIFE